MARSPLAGGEAAYQYVVKAVELALAGQIAVIVTAPLNKGAMHAAGHHFDGHTELLAHLTGAKSSFMLLASDKLSVVHVTTHVSLQGRDPARDHRARARQPFAPATSTSRRSAMPARASPWPG